jgi:hypothetical protein
MFGYPPIWRGICNTSITLISRDIVDAEQFKGLAIFVIEKLADTPRDISSRSSKVNALFERL